MPPALLTNAFANPLEVCAAGAIIMTPRRPLLQRTSLCCAKMSLSIMDDGGVVDGNSHWCAGSPRRLLEANLMPIGAREEGPESPRSPAPLAPESKVQGLQTPTGGYALCCSLADRGIRSPAGGKGRSFCPSRLKTSGPFSHVA